MNLLDRVAPVVREWNTTLRPMAQSLFDAIPALQQLQDKWSKVLGSLATYIDKLRPFRPRKRAAARDLHPRSRKAVLMLRTVLASRGFITVATLLIVAAAAVGGYSLLRPVPEMRAYCALMPDSIGLYPGSAVTIRGISQGRVTSITPNGKTAKVTFRIPASDRLPIEVGATTGIGHPHRRPAPRSDRQ